MTDLFSGLKRHRVSRAAVAYGVVAWFLVQLISNLSPILNIPMWVGKAVLLVIATAFPITLVVSWAFDIGAVETASQTPRFTLSDYLLIGTAALVILAITYQGLAPLAATSGATDEIRNIYRIAAIYTLLGYTLFWGGSMLAPTLKSPRWYVGALLLLLATGFPIAIASAVALKVDVGAMSNGTVRPVLLDAGLATALFLVLGISLFRYTPIHRGGRPQPGNEATAKASSTAALPSTSVAVLPFLNLSADPGEDYFSDGMTIEITSALANVPGLLVIGRVSAFKFRGHSQDLRAIGLELGTTHLIEGSVRKSGGRVRITVELIQATDAVCIWAEAYDRQLLDVFAIQEEIAQSVASAMHVPLGLKAPAVRNRTKDLDSYQNYLRAKALIRARGIANLTRATSLLEDVVGHDPNYAPAWSMLAWAYMLIPNFHPAFFVGDAQALRSVVNHAIPRAEEAARMAIKLDPCDEYAYMSLGLVLNARGKLVEAFDNYSKAIELDPANPDVLHLYSGFLMDVGYLKKSRAGREKLQELEPLVPVFSWITALVNALNGREDLSIAALEKLSPDALTAREYYLARMYTLVGRYREAADILETIPFGDPSLIATAVRLLRMAPLQVTAPETLPALHILGFAYVPVGAIGRFFDFYERNMAAQYLCNGMGWIWHSSYAEIRKTERFDAFVRASGLDAYWRKFGPPEPGCLPDASIFMSA